MAKSLNPIDYDDEFHRPRKSRNRKTATGVRKEYRLRDPQTGLYWGVSGPERPQFNMQGKSWSSKSSCRKNWAEYDLARMRDKKDFGYPRVLVVEEFEVATVSKGDVDLILPDMSPVAALDVGKSHVVSTFMHQLCLDDWMFSHIVFVSGDKDDILSRIPSQLKVKTDVFEFSSWRIGGAKDVEDEVKIAVLSDKDLMVIMMIFGEKVGKVYDRQGRIIEISRSDH